jgi:hypothetical protein
VSKRKRQTGLQDIQTRTRQTPAERILAQRTSRAEVYIDTQEEDHRHDQQLRSGPVQQPVEKGNSQLSPDKDMADRHQECQVRQRQPPAAQQVLNAAQQSPIDEHFEGDQNQEEEEEEEDHHCETRAKESARHQEESMPPLCPSLTLNTKVPQALAVQDSQLAPAAKRRVGFAFGYYDFVLKLL